MTTPSETKSRFEQLLSKIYPKRPCKDQKVCIDCLKPKSNKNKFESKSCGYSEFCVLNYQNSSFVILSSL